MGDMIKQLTALLTQRVQNKAGSQITDQRR